MSPFIRLKRINLSYNILNNENIELLCDSIEERLRIDEHFILSIKEIILDFHSNINEFA